MTDAPSATTPDVAADVLALPAGRGAAVVALRLLASVVERGTALRDSADAEALHDFRVALRQLRGWLRAFEPVLGDAVGAKLQRRLRRIARTSNDARDADVQLQWLHAQYQSLPPEAHPALATLTGSVTERRQRADQRFTERMMADFERTHRAIARALEPATAPSTSAASGEAVHTLGAAAASVLHHRAGRLRAHLDAVRDVGDDSAAHRARLAGKRLRYVLQALAADIPRPKVAIAHLKAMQDALGELHDAHVLIGQTADALSRLLDSEGERLVAAVRDVGAGADRFLDRRPAELERGLLLIAARLHERAALAFAEVRDAWLGARADVVATEVEALARRLTADAARPLVEIERKYLLRALPVVTQGARVLEIEQGYLPGSEVTERLRHVRENGDERWVRTVKTGNGLVRTEVEEEAEPDVVATLWPLTEGRRVRKRRYEIDDGPLTWQVDEFLDRRLVLAEVELPSADVAVELPMWLEPLVVREVTGEAEFANAELARRS